MQNLFYYLTTVIVWGSTWLAITFQLGTVDPMLSVGYRFLLAALLLQGYCYLKSKPMRFSFKDHLLIALQGILLFGLNYWLFYLAELYLTSGLVALIFSMVVFLNILNSAIFLRTPIHPRMIAGAGLGLCGIILVFWPEVSALSVNRSGLYGLLLSLIATYLTSIANIVSARNQKNGLPVIQTNAYGMGYAAVAMLLLAVVSGKPFLFEPTVAYIGAMLYLAVFGSIIGFGCYLTLIGRIGAGRAAYATLLFPLVALAISTVYEGYQWRPAAILGVVLILAGNLAMVKPEALRNLVCCAKRIAFHPQT